jgi:hypothetical protein
MIGLLILAREVVRGRGREERGAAKRTRQGLFRRDAETNARDGRAPRKERDASRQTEPRRPLRGKSMVSGLWSVVGGIR